MIKWAFDCRNIFNPISVGGARGVDSSQTEISNFLIWYQAMGQPFTPS